MKQKVLTQAAAEAMDAQAREEVEQAVSFASRRRTPRLRMPPIRLRRDIRHG